MPWINDRHMVIYVVTYNMLTSLDSFSSVSWLGEVINIILSQNLKEGPITENH